MYEIDGVGDFDLAEEAMHEAFAAALSLWPRSGVPGQPATMVDFDGQIQSH
jgi:RNA polymerase sigma-70 factor (ECF subfamily)